MWEGQVLTIAPHAVSESKCFPSPAPSDRPQMVLGEKRSLNRRDRDLQLVPFVMEATRGAAQARKRRP